MIVKGYRGRLSIEDAEFLASREIYVVNAKCVGGKEHMIYAYNKAREMIKKGKNIANKFHIELMLILTGSRQINKALELAGVKDADEIVSISEREFELDLPRDDKVIECEESKLDYLKIENFVKGKECDAFFENSALLYLER